MMSTPTVPPVDAGIDPRDAALDDPVPGIDFRDLPDANVFRLRFRDAQFRFEIGRIGHARQIRSRRRPARRRSTGTSCSTPSMPALTFKSSSWRAAQIVRRAALIHVRFLRRDLGLDASRLHFEPFLPDGQPVGEFLRGRARLLQLNF